MNVHNKAASYYKISYKVEDKETVVYETLDRQPTKSYDNRIDHRSSSRQNNNRKKFGNKKKRYNSSTKSDKFGNKNSTTKSSILGFIIKSIFGKKSMSNSIHLQLFPHLHHIGADDVVESMDIVRKICNAALSIRKSNNVKVKIPLNSIIIHCDNNVKIEEFTNLIADEINVKNVIIQQDIENITKSVVHLNMANCGVKLGKALPSVLGAIKRNDFKIVDNVLKVLDFELDQDYFSLNFVCEQKNGLKMCDGLQIVVEMDLNINKELLLEGLSRELIRAIQQCRKDENLDITDRIEVSIVSDKEDILLAVNLFMDNIKLNVLAENLVIVNDTNSNPSYREYKINDETILISLSIVK